MDSIWKDIYVDFGAVASVNYNVEVTGYGEVFNGKAFARPGASTCLVRINDIIADAFGMLRSLPWSTFSGLSWPIEVVVNNLDTSTEEYRENVVMDWSYDYDRDVDTEVASEPITGEILNGQYFMVSLLPPFPLSVDIDETDEDGVTTQETFSTANAWTSYFADSDLVRRLKESNTAVIDTAEFSYDPVTFEVDGVPTTYKMVSCGEFVLYYLNAFGGWDSLVMHHQAKQEDTLTRHNVGVDYDNTQSYGRGKVNYVNEISRHLTMRTGWLTDAQSARMHHLLNSPCVYVHDIVRGRIYPLVLTNTTTEYKTFQNQGLRMVDYVVEADLAVDMMRQ